MVVLDDLFVLAMASGAVDVLVGGKFSPCNALGRPHHPLESFAVVGGAVAVPDSDTARQDALNCASVKVSEVLRGQATFLQPPEVEKALLKASRVAQWLRALYCSASCAIRVPGFAPRLCRNRPRPGGPWGDAQLA